MIQKPIEMRLKLKGGKDSVIPKGYTTDLLIKIIDGKAAYRFDRSSITKAFCAKRIKDGFNSIYVERFQTTMCEYPGMNQQEIVEHITKCLKELTNVRPNNSNSNTG